MNEIVINLRLPLPENDFIFFGKRHLGIKTKKRPDIIGTP